MPIIANNSATGSVVAKLTIKGRQTLLTDGQLNINGFRLFDNEINYQLLNPDNIDQDDQDILYEAVFEGSADDTATEYAYSRGAGVLLNNPYFVVQQPTLSGNKITDNPLYAQNQEIILDIGALTGDNSFLFASQTTFTGNVINIAKFFSVKVNVTDQNGSAINGANVSIYSNNLYTSTQTIKDNTFVIFSNLASSQPYKIFVNNQSYQFRNSNFGGGFWTIDDLESNNETTFVGTPVSLTAASLTLSGTLSSGITSVAISGVPVSLHYGNVLQSTTSDVTGKYSFTSLSSGISYFVTVNTSSYYYSNNTSGLTDSLTASRAVNFLLYPASQFSGTLYYYNTVNPISNAIINLYQGAVSGNISDYIASYATDMNGNFTFPNISLQKDFYLKGYLDGYTFVNIPYVLQSSSVTSSITGITLYAKKNERPIQYDIPFPFRRRPFLINDKSEFAVFHNTCAWAFNSIKPAIVIYDASYSYTPINLYSVLQTNNYLDTIKTLEGPYVFKFNSTNRTKNSFDQDAFSPYISDNYTIKINLYALPYQYSLAQNNPQWDVFSKNDEQIMFPVQINPNATGATLEVLQNTTIIDEVPNYQNGQFAVSVNDVSKLSSLLPRTQLNVPTTVSNNNALPRLGLINPATFNIDSSIMNVTLSPFEVATNNDYVTYTSIKGADKTIPVQVVIDDFENVSVQSFENQVNTQEWTVSNAPLPIFVPGDSFLATTLYSNNLKFTYNLQDYIQTIRSQGFVWNRVIQWTVDGIQYTPDKQNAYITINAFGANNTVEQLMLTVNGAFYQVSQEFIQFLISYFGIPSTDQQTINTLTQNNALVDWLFYIFIINFGAYKNAYSTGKLQTLFSTTKNSKLVIINDILQKGNSLVDVANSFVQTQFQPTQNGLNLITNTANVNIRTTSGNGANQNNQTPQGLTLNGLGSTDPNGLGSVTGTGTGPNAVNGGGITLQGGIAPTDNNTSVIVKQQYAIITKELSNCILLNTVNDVLVSLYQFSSFSWRVPYHIFIRTINTVQVTNVVQKPIQTVKVITQNITPIVTRLINISNANNYFNANPSVDKKFILTIKFDLTNPSTQDNFLKMINYLIDNIYTLYIGVEIVDNGNITKNLNAPVITTSDYVNAPIEVQSVFSQQDCVQFLVPLTVGGIVRQTSQVNVGDPVTFNGNGFIKLIRYNVDAQDQTNNVYHILRLIDLSNTGGANTQLINNGIVNPNDYIAFDLLQINGTLNSFFLKRYLQILNSYNYSLMNLDINDLRNVLTTQYNAISGVNYVGSFGGAFASSTKGPNFWNSSLINWQQGATAISIIQKILTTTNPTSVASQSVTDIGSIVTSLNDFSNI